jgi:GAF domain-containing protein
VIPVIQNNKVRAVLDVDSNQLATFDSTDQHYLEEIVGWLEFV